MPKTLFNKVTIIGVGLIGGSLGLAIKKRQVASQVVGIFRSEDSADRALKRGAVDQSVYELKEGLVDADLVILSTNISTIIDHLKKIDPLLKKGSIVIDVGRSVKSPIIRTAKDYIKTGHFIGCHPMAGSEKTGVANADPDLFLNSTCLVPSNEESKNVNTVICNFWKQVGCKSVMKIDPAEKHDLWVAFSSHFPHVISYAMFNRSWNDISDWIQSKSTGNLNRSILAMARISHSDPTLWSDIFSHNSENVLKEIGAFEEKMGLNKLNLKINPDPRLQRRFSLIRPLDDTL